MVILVFYSSTYNSLVTVGFLALIGACILCLSIVAMKLTTKDTAAKVLPTEVMKDTTRNSSIT